MTDLTDVVDDERLAVLLDQLRAHADIDERVLAAMARVPREMFVPPTFRSHAYDNTALPIGQGQTVSQPEVVAMMTSHLELDDRLKVLEIGTGSGYQTAVLAHLCRRVYSIERRRSLLKEAEERLAELRLHNVTTQCGDGALGWPEQAPFDRIIVTAAAEEEVPPKLIDQLGVGGIMVVPVAHSAINQRMLKLVRHEGEIQVSDLGPVRFVPLVTPHDHGRPQPLAKTIAKLRRRD